MKFNGGLGAVICDDCRRIFDTGIGVEEYDNIYGSGNDYCYKCRPEDYTNPKIKIPPIKERKETPCGCYYCGDWIEEFDLFFVESDGNPVCLDCIGEQILIP